MISIALTGYTQTLYASTDAIYSPPIIHNNLENTNTNTNNSNAPNTETLDNTVLQSIQLQTIEVKGKKRLGRKDNEVTGLGKVVKNITDLNKEQVMGIRDLTRYDPGISVVEQGRGATAGYAIRGVDKNRVGLLVDGLAQAQSYTTLFSKANGGAINEIEYENIRSIEVGKGASSSDYGNGALGGAVSLQTKEASDVIKTDKNWGINSKHSYASKNNQSLHSVEMAFRTGGLEALTIYTKRNGQETKVHPEAPTQTQTIKRLSGYANIYDIRPSKSPEAYASDWFIIQDECPTLNCKPKAGVLATTDNPSSLRTNPPLTDKELAQHQQSIHPSETMTAVQYTGDKRIMPNPMDYQSQSWFFKGGYRFSPKHYVGAVFEDTAQQYNIQDMRTPAYYLPEENKAGNKLNKSAYAKDQLLNGIRLNLANLPAGLNWTRTQFFDEKHHKQRLGLFYQYNNKGDWVDTATFGYNHQNITLDSISHDRRCAPYPTVDKNCRASIDKPWSYYKSEKNSYNEKHDKIELNLQKSFEYAKSKHKIDAIIGAQKQQSNLARSDYMHEYTEQKWDSIKDGLPYAYANGEYSKPYVYKAKPANIQRKDLCDYSGNNADLSDCSGRKIDGYNYFVALKDTVTLSKYADLGLSLRYDYHRYTSNDDWTAQGTYRNWSWNGGLTVKPNRHVALSYRISNGFRVPAFYEMYGRRIQGAKRDSSKDFTHIGQFKPEKSLNQEIGINIKGNFGYLETSYFYNHYKDMIALAELRGLVNDQFGYHNIQNVTLNGINLIGKLDWHGINEKMPEGFYSTLAYNKTQVKKREVDAKFTNTHDPVLDAIQPSKYIIGTGYDDPNGKWGITHTFTYSAAKNNDEITGNKYSGNTSYHLREPSSNSWFTYDLVAYFNLNQNATLRAGIYNMTNRKYSTYESLRQSSINAINKTDYQSASYVAPGKNVAVSLEMKF